MVNKKNIIRFALFVTAAIFAVFLVGCDEAIPPKPAPTTQKHLLVREEPRGAADHISCKTYNGVWESTNMVVKVEEDGKIITVWDFALSGIGNKMSAKCENNSRKAHIENERLFFLTNDGAHAIIYYDTRDP